MAAAASGQVRGQCCQPRPSPSSLGGWRPSLTAWHIGRRQCSWAEAGVRLRRWDTGGRRSTGSNPAGPAPKRPSRYNSSREMLQAYTVATGRRIDLSPEGREKMTDLRDKLYFGITPRHSWGMHHAVYCEADCTFIGIFCKDRTACMLRRGAKEQ